MLYNASCGTEQGLHKYVGSSEKHLRLTGVADRESRHYSLYTLQVIENLLGYFEYLAGFIIFLEVYVPSTLKTREIHNIT